MESGDDNYSLKTCKVPVKSSLPANQHPTFLQAGCPSCRPTNSVKALNGEVTHYTDLLTSSSPGGLPSLSLTTNSSWLPCGRVAMTIRPMMPVPQTLFCMQQNVLKYTISQFLWHGRSYSLATVANVNELL